MGGRLRLASVTGVLFACCVAACGDDSPKGFVIEQGGDRPDTPGAGGGLGGHAGMGSMSGMAGRAASPSPLTPPASNIAAGSMCEADGWCWYNPLPSGAWWQGVAGAGRTDLWIGGMSQNLLHFDGGHWTTRISPLEITEAIWAASENDVWFGGLSRAADGTSAAGIAHWDGAAVTMAGTFGGGEIQDVWGSSANDVYAAGFGTLQHWDGSAWSTVPGIAGGSVSGSGPNDVWVGQSNGMWHWDGTSWSRSPQLEGTFIQSVSAAGPGDAWAAVLSAGTQTARHFDGTSWTISFQTDDTINTNIWVQPGAARLPEPLRRRHVVAGVAWSRADLAVPRAYDAWLRRHRRWHERRHPEPGFHLWARVPRSARRRAGEPVRHVGQLADGHVGGRQPWQRRAL